jgi:hypothetical protein
MADILEGIWKEIVMALAILAFVWGGGSEKTNENPQEEQQMT